MPHRDPTPDAALPHDIAALPQGRASDGDAAARSGFVAALHKGPPRAGELRDLGRRDYLATYALQKELVAARQAGAVPDTLILVEHPDVITLGRRSTARGNVLREDMPVVEVERGGDVTYHGPGQLVAYPILALAEPERDVHALLRAIEGGVIAACGRLGVPASRRPGYAGVWTAEGGRKLASIGVAVRGWVTFHGVALNVSTDLARFRSINPCGMEANVMTSLSERLGRAVSLDEVKPVLVASLGEALGRRFA